MFCYLCCRDISTTEFVCDKHDESLHFCCELHYSYHRSHSRCLPWSVSSNTQYGRYLVASRDIAPGDLILQEECLCWGPNHDLQTVVCVECLSDVSDQVSRCDQCGSPLCCQHSVKHPQHDQECQLLSQAGQSGLVLTQTLTTRSVSCA